MAIRARRPRVQRERPQWAATGTEIGGGTVAGVALRAGVQPWVSARRAKLFAVVGASAVNPCFLLGIC